MTIPSAVVIGSGFGGSVMACRLAESGRFSVTVLERGRRYGRNEFPRRPDQLRDAFWDPRDGKLGLFEYQTFRKSDVEVWTASGLGGGSLIYANVLYEAPAEFLEGWPGGIRRALLDSYYERVHEMMESRSYPVNEPWPYAETPKTRTLQRAYERMMRRPLGYAAATLEYPRLAVQFGPNPGFEIVNRQGVRQTACVRCGECDIGCNYHAKNTLDLNYLERARQCGAAIQTGAEVLAITARTSGGYRVRLADPRHPDRSEEIDADLVILGAGSLGSTRLLLRMKQNGDLPNLGPALGSRWSGNGDLLGLSLKCRDPVYPNTGPVITSAVRFFHGGYPDGFPHGLYVEDAGIPNFLAWYISAYTSGWRSVANRILAFLRYARGLFAGRGEVNIGDDLSAFLFNESQLVSRTMIFLGMGRDRANGTLSLRQSKRTVEGFDLHLSWDSKPSALHFDRLREAMRRLTDALGGSFQENPVSLSGKAIAVHPLGGCPMGESLEDGVVDATTGEAFGHPGLYVVDGSIIPASIGPNPSLTIAAIAELFAERLLERHTSGGVS